MERSINENKWQRDIGDRRRLNLIKDVVSVVFTVVIVYTSKPLPLNMYLNMYIMRSVMEYVAGWIEAMNSSCMMF